MFGVQMLSLVKQRTKLKLLKIFLPVEIYGSLVDVHTDWTITLDALFLTWFTASCMLVLIHDVNSKLVQAEGRSFGLQRTVVNMFPTQVIMVEKAIMDKEGLGKKHGQCFIFIVASVAASSLIHTLPCRFKC